LYKSGLSSGLVFTTLIHLRQDQLFETQKK